MMLILKSANASPIAKSQLVATAIESVDRDWLREVVERISIPRHFESQPENNQEIARWIELQFQAMGYHTFRQGKFDNIVAVPPSVNAGAMEDFRPRILVGAHYDSKPETPGADDNASAVAAMLGCAKALAEGGVKNAKDGIVFVAFNREEDGLIGSVDFVNNFLPRAWSLKEVHILEMVGYCDHAEGSQSLPSGIPVKLSHRRGDFLALIGNRYSNSLLKPILKCAKTYVPDFPVWGLKVFFGLENRFADLRRSDHAPFWDKKIAALMWTDTSEFRNPNYHQPSDTPDTLDYEFLQKVTRLLVARVLSV